MLRKVVMDGECLRLSFVFLRIWNSVRFRTHVQQLLQLPDRWAGRWWHSLFTRLFPCPSRLWHLFTDGIRDRATLGSRLCLRILVLCPANQFSVVSDHSSVE